MKLTDTNQPCGLTIDSFSHYRRRATRALVAHENMRVRGERNYRLQDIQLSQTGSTVRACVSGALQARRESQVPAGVCSAATL